ncbi:hypothetical protein AB0N73_12210 [Microbacterium sp. NPDC089189]|uniref:hypothetical protein n=1 Tax=Microbacterium sp. NPDC089189 TaxID=3154972 RepID=UPI00343496C8
MPMTGREFDPLHLIWGVLSFPPISLLVALLITGGILIVASRPGRVGRPPLLPSHYAPERRTLGAVAAGVIVLFLVEFVLRGYVFAGPGPVHWWRFAVPLAAAAVGLCIALGVIATRGTTAPDAPFISATRRHWRSFSSRAALSVTAVVALALIATTVAAGLASSTDGEGQHTWLVIPIPNEAAIDPIRLPFYGWIYGIPVLTALAALGAVAWATLDRNAARPFRRSETVAAERAARRVTATDVTRIVTAAMLLALAAAWRLIATAGSGSSLTVMGEDGDTSYDAAWRYAELAVAAGWFVPVLSVTAFVLLLLTAVSGLRATRTGLAQTSEAEPFVGAGAGR